MSVVLIAGLGKAKHNDPRMITRCGGSIYRIPHLAVVRDHKPLQLHWLSSYIATTDAFCALSKRRFS